MRPLKFRAWDKSVNTMWPVSSISLASDGTVIVYTEQPYDFGDIEVEMSINTPVMQFTGLQDKNGRDIYEGDIIEYGEYGQEVVEWAYGTDGDGYGVSGFAFNNEVDRENASYGGTVIGNVYENPELLAGTSK